MLKLIYWHRFEKDLKLAKKRGHDIEKFTTVVDLLLRKELLPTRMCNHKLTGEYRNCWECHVEPDWLLIYRKTAVALILMRTGKHSDLF